VRLSSWPSFGKNAGFDLANQRGYFQDEGIDFDLITSYQQAALVPLSAGEVEVAQMLCSDALNAIEQGGELRVIGVRDAKFPVGTVSLATSNIRTPADYAGKRWGHNVGNSPEQKLLPTLAAQTGFDPTTVKLVHVDYPAQLGALIQGQIDFVSAWWGSGYPEMLLAARDQGVELRFIRWSDYGIDVYGECLVARVDWLDEHPDLAKAFLSSAVKGFLDSQSEPDAAVDAVIASNADQSEQREAIKLQVIQSMELVNDEYVDQHGLFSISGEKLSRTRDAILGMTTKVAIENTFTNEYLPGT
jgi:NitT/TauT family transport system substrate-binding protein